MYQKYKVCIVWVPKNSDFVFENLKINILKDSIKICHPFKKLKGLFLIGNIGNF